MRGLADLQHLITPAPGLDVADELLAVAKAFVAKRRTRDTSRVSIDALRVEPAYQRPPNRDKIAAMHQQLKAGGTLPPIKCNVRPDGSLWITDGQHRAAARALHGEDEIDAVLTYKPQTEESAETNLMAKVAAGSDGETIGVLLAAGAEPDGKGLTVDLGAGGRVSYLPHASEYVAKTERGTLTVDAPDDAWEIVAKLGLGDLRLETPAAG